MVVSRRITLEEEGLDDMKNIMSRVHLTSKWGNIQREWVDPWKHEDRPSPGCESLLSSRTLRCGDHDRIFISWKKFLGFVSRTESTNTLPKRQREFLLVLRTEVQGKMSRRLNHDQSLLWRCLWCIPCRKWKWMDVEPRKIQSRCQNLWSDWQTSSRQSLMVFRTGQLEAWISFLEKRGGPKKRFQYCLNPNSFKYFLYSEQSRDIQEVLSLTLHCI